jgi:hypothetical protein
MELKPKDPEELKKMQTDELTNGRLGMIAAVGLVAQEMASHDKIFAMLSVSGAEFDGEAYAKTLPGIREDLSFWIRWASARRTASPRARSSSTGRSS